MSKYNGKTSIEKVLREFYRKLSYGKSKVGCLEDFVIDSYVSGKLSEEEEKKVDTHLLVCGYCLHKVSKLEADIKQIKVQESIDKKSVLENVFEIVVGFTKAAIQIISTSGVIKTGQLQPEYVRGVKQGKCDIIRVGQKIADIELDVDIFYDTNTGAKEVMVAVKDIEMSRRPKFVLSLFRNNIKIETKNTDIAGVARFENISYGNNVLKLYEEDRELGRVNLILQELV